MGSMMARVNVGLVCVGLVLCTSTAFGAPPTWPTARQVWVDAFEGPGVSDFWEDNRYPR